MSRIVHLEVNDSGGWRRVTSFDTFNEGDLEVCAGHLLELSSNDRLKARIIAPGDTAPRVIWNKRDGWREWRHPGESQQQGLGL